jgi:hypothetical protein
METNQELKKLEESLTQVDLELLVLLDSGFEMVCNQTSSKWEYELVIDNMTVDYLIDPLVGDTLYILGLFDRKNKDITTNLYSYVLSRKGQRVLAFVSLVFKNFVLNSVLKAKGIEIDLAYPRHS